MKEITVCCAIMRNRELILIARRSANMSMPLLWEFPGGKLEKGENPEACLIREIQEELNVAIRINKFIGKFSHPYSNFIIHLLAFEVELIQGIPHASEHQELRWVRVDELKNFTFTEADLPIVELICH
jgi:8-oxo-dGTP diphosphatase